MSLISDPDFLIHSMRLSYLRNVDDPYGPRIMSLNQHYNSNPYILAASLADSDRWPELAMPSSPQPSDDEHEQRSEPNASGFPGAPRLKYTQTIVGPSHGGAMGMRVSGSRRSSTVSKRDSRTPRQSLAPNALNNDSGPIPEADVATGAPPSMSIGERGAAESSWVNVPDKDKLPALSPRPIVEDKSEDPPPAPPAKEVQFIPKFKGAAEMEARRRVRMQARVAPAVAEVKPPPPPPIALNPEFSSSDEDESDNEILDEDADDFDDDFDLADGDSDEDDFDPDFAATRTPGANSDSASEVLSVFSGPALSTSNSSIPDSSPQNSRARPRLSPVSEAAAQPPQQRSDDRHIDSYFEMVTPPIPSKSDHRDASARRKPEALAKLPAASPGRPPYTSTPSSTEMTFARRKVPPIRPAKSALTAMLASSGGSSNPFTELYAAISGRAETASMTVQVYFPHARRPAGKAMELNVRKDASIEEVIGFALWNYWEEGWAPPLDEGLSGEDDPKWQTRLSAVGWIMRIAEDDGEVDDDFPPPDRTGRISKFNFDAYAVLEATPDKIAENQALEAKIQRRPSRIMAASKRAHTDPAGTAGGLVPPSMSGPAGSSALNGSSLGSLPLSTSLGPSSSHGPLIFLRIRVADTADAIHISTTIPVSAGMYIQDALELICQKRQLPPSEYALLLGDKSLLIPLDRTVASLQGTRDLLLVKRSNLPEMGIDVVKTIPRTTDPNASIFKRASEVPAAVKYTSNVMDFTTSYKKYIVYRKMPMLVTRHERILAIDGVYIHIMPSANKAKAVFDSGKTTSYHLASIVECQQSSKSSSAFKLIIQRDRRQNKRYDFEAESPKLAAEIVHSIRSLKTAPDRNGTLNRSRRSRAVV
ncbi:hypothetical protein PLICRDRAFT_57646 [Plicaturopsis crispa FD-325 SS-3]|uniref:RBD domain-containing protein n=1 Tax=Plicaturopsis crispa FD-325 SS-3 TaxID=944288 RepID=A0A0C9T8X2_PLICR|nr:hypothetical protein PLICRDRAFT_57646 [Plicaturopsis crispa FD-325 SS-3]